MSSCTSAPTSTPTCLSSHVHCGGGGGGVSAAGGGMGAGHPGSLSAYWFGCAIYMGYGSCTFNLVTDCASGLCVKPDVPKNLCCFECGNFTANSYGRMYPNLWPGNACCFADGNYGGNKTSCIMMAFTGFSNSMVGKTVYVEALYYGNNVSQFNYHGSQRLVDGYLTEGMNFCSYPYCFNCCLNNFDSYQTIGFSNDFDSTSDHYSLRHGGAYTRICTQGTCSHSHAGRLTRVVKYQNCLFLEPRHLRELYVYNVQ